MASASVVTIGTYDGVHLGHRKLIALAREEGREADLPVAVVTFDRHPASVVRPGLAPRLLTEIDHKLELLRRTGVDDVVVLHFDAGRAKEEAEDFVESVLVGELGARAVVVGTNFRFGHAQRGDPKMLSSLGRRLGFSTRTLGLVTDDETGEVISASRIRHLVERGDLVEAARLLGRPHEVRGLLAELSSPDEGALGIVLAPRLSLPPPGRYAVEVGLPGADGFGVEARLTGPDERGGAQLVLDPRWREAVKIPLEGSRVAAVFSLGATERGSAAR